MKTTMKKLYIVLAVILFALLPFLSFGEVYTANAETDTSAYTSVLDDLQKDDNFVLSDYPSDNEDYSLSVFQIAESEDGELFLYVYRPYTGSAYDLTATSINMSLFKWKSDETKYFVYTLTLIDEYGVFQKYIVDGFAVSTAETRYYDISAIYRPFYSDIDDEQDNGNTTDEISFEVGKCWRADTDSSGNVTYSMQQTDVLLITSKRVGYVEYSNGFNLYGSWCESHFVAFDCDYDIDYLYEADVYYISRTYSVSVGAGLDGERHYYDDESENYVYLTHTDTVTHTGSGWRANTYTWNRIEKASEFIADEDYTLTDDATEDIADMQWVLRFAETDLYAISSNGVVTNMGTEISSVTILRLKFMSNGWVYNLGVVNNRTSGSGSPDGSAGGISIDNWLDKWLEDFENMLKKILAVIAVVIVVVICMPILPYVAKFIVWVISLPFKLIKAIRNAFKKRE